MFSRRSILLAGLRTTLGICVTCVGCQFVPLSKESGEDFKDYFYGQQPAVAAQAAPPSEEVALVSSPSNGVYTVQAGDTLHWALSSSQRLPDGLVGGKSRINDNGTISLGRFGSVAVGGLTPEESRVALEKHLSSQLNHPQLHVQLTAQTDDPRAAPHAVEAAPPSTTLVKPSNPSSPATVPQTVGWRAVQKGSASGAGKNSFPDRLFPLPEATNVRTSVAPPPATVSSPNAAERPDSANVRVAHVPPVATEDRQAAVTWASWQPVAQAKEPVPAKVPLGGAAPSKAPAHESFFGLGMPTRLDNAPFPVEAAHPPAPRELDKISLPPYVIEPPDVLLVESTKAAPDQPISGQHLVRPDGTIGLGIYGSVYVAGLTLDQAKAAIEAHLSLRIKQPEVSVDVTAYNSKVYYVITDGGGYGEQVTRFPVTGNETVLDAIGLINGLPPVASKKIWVARRSSGTGCPGQEIILPVDWCAITQHGITDTNFQIFPGDRVYVKADRWRTFDARVAKVLSPFERMFGISLLGGATYNTISGRNTGGTSGLGAVR